MRKIVCLVVLAALAVPLSARKPARKYHEPIRVGTYNIQYDRTRDTVNGWSTRKLILARQLRQLDFDIFGAQEPLKEQMAYIGSVLAPLGYAWVGLDVAGGTDETRKSYNPIIYKATRFELLDWGQFNLSENPGVPNVKGWDAYSVRVCTWAKFRDKTSGAVFRHFNVHFDHRGRTARDESAKLMVARIGEMAGTTPAFLTGDFNADQHTEAYRTLAESGVVVDALRVAEQRTDDDWHSFSDYVYREVPEPGGERIDHVFVTPGTRVASWQLVHGDFDRKYPSDHFPIVVGWRLPQ